MRSTVISWFSSMISQLGSLFIDRKAMARSQLNLHRHRRFYLLSFFSSLVAFSLLLIGQNHLFWLKLDSAVTDPRVTEINFKWVDEKFFPFGNFLYSMFFFDCNITWRHKSKSNRDNWILKKVPKSWWWCILWYVTPRTFLQKSIPLEK